MIVTAGKTNVSVYYYIVQDASGTSPGEPVTGLLFSDIETGGSASYARQGAARVDLTLITLASASATHADGGFILVDDTNMPGVYRCDYPDAAFATGIDQVFLSIVVASGKNAVAAPILIDITDVDLRDKVRAGLTALPNAAADAAGGLPISDAGGLDMDGLVTAVTIGTPVDTDISKDIANVQTSIGNLAVGSSAISVETESYVLTTGTQSSGGITDTETLNSVYHQHTDTAGVLELYYQFDVTTVGTASEVTVIGRINGNNDDLDGVYAWNWVGSAWDRIGSYIGQTSSADNLDIFPLLVRHTGLGVNIGKVRIRFFAASGLTSSTLSIDQIFTSYAAVPSAGEIFDSGVAQAGAANSITLAATASSNDDFYNRAKVILTSGTGLGQEAIITDYSGTTKVATTTPAWTLNPNTTSVYQVVPGQAHSTIRNGGYDNGYVYVDVVNGSAGTTKGVNGTTTEKSSVLADARTIADNEGIRKFRLEGGGAFSLDQSYTNWIFEHVSASLITLNSKDISGTVFMRSGITGVGTMTTRGVFELCAIIDVTIGICNFLQCGFVGTTTLTAETSYLAWHCFENQSSGTGPVIDMAGDGVTPTTLELLGYEGRIEIKNMTSVDVLIVTGNVKLILNANCSGGSLTKAGDIKITDNSGNVTITTGNIDDILTDTADMQPKLGSPAGASISADIATVDTVVDAVKVVTDKFAFTVANKVDSNVTAIAGDATSATNLSKSAIAIDPGTAIAGTLSTTEMTTNLTEATDDHYIGRIIIWTSGVLKNQATTITDYTGSSKKLTYATTTEAPSNNDTFVIL